MEENDLRLLVGFLQERLQDATAVVCYNDEIAYSMVQALFAAGRRVPEDTAVVSFDNSYLSQLGPVPITSLGPRSHIGRAAAEHMIALLNGEMPASEFLEWKLVPRGSG